MTTMTDTPPAVAQPSEPATLTGGRSVVRAAIWLPGLAVALGAAVATAHGLYEVAVAARVPAVIAWLYPLITDGLALVAYAATARLMGSARRYAWAVVILAAGLSRLAQAAYLASDAAAAPLPVSGLAASAGFVAPAALRFGVGAWPAIAAAIVAHLLYLLATDHQHDHAEHRRSAATACPVPYGWTAADPYTAGPAVPSMNGHRLTDAALVQPVDRTTAEQASEPSGEAFTRPLPVVSGSVRRELDAPARDRARTAARRHADRHGAWPTVTQLMNLAEVSRGTAGEALKHLRDQPPRPQHDAEPPNEETQP